MYVEKLFYLIFATAAVCRTADAGSAAFALGPLSFQKPSRNMVQSVNVKALTTLASVIRRPYLASPHVFVPTVSGKPCEQSGQHFHLITLISITVVRPLPRKTLQPVAIDVNYQALKDHCGVKAVIFDKDNTLTAPYENGLHPRARVGLQSALDVFGQENVAILSNSAGTDDDPGFVDGKEIEEALGIAVIKHSEKKPGGLDETIKHFPNVSDPSQLCMVGDRLLTDVVFGNLHGMLTVHILPLCSGKENRRDNKVAKVVRIIENKIMYGNWWGGRKIRQLTLPHKSWRGEDECPLVISDGSSTTIRNDELGEIQ